MRVGLWLDVFLRHFVRRSQHQSLLITAAKLVTTVSSTPYKRWNFRKANWELYSFITNKLAKDLPSPYSRCMDETYQDFCSSISQAAKISISRGRRNNYRPCWVAECESFYQKLFKAPWSKESNKDSSDLFAQIDEKRREHW